MRTFDMHTTWDEVQDMTAEEAIAILAKHAVYKENADWGPRPHMAKTLQLAIAALQKEI